MSLELVTGTLLALHLGRRKDTVGLQREQVGVGKLANVGKAMRVCQAAHELLGGQDVTVERHLADLEREHSDAPQIQTLVADALTAQRGSQAEQLRKGGG
jgi:glutaryl-CoA dehydrogenase